MPRKPTGRPRGRQMGSGTLGLGTQDEHTRLTLRIPNDLYTRLEAFAAGRHFHRGSPQLAGCVRDAIEHYLACPNKRLTHIAPEPARDEIRQTVNGTHEVEDKSRQTVNVPAVPAKALETLEHDTWQTSKVLEQDTEEIEHDNRQTENDDVSQTAALDAMPLGPVDTPQQPAAPIPDTRSSVEARRVRLLDALPVDGDGLTPGELRAVTGSTRVQITNDVRLLQELGHVRNTGDGHYLRTAAPATR